MTDHIDPTPGGATPPTAFCGLHPGVASVGTCSHCGTFGCGDCLGTIEGKIVCRTCVTTGRVTAGQSPWDKRKELGLFAAAWQTLMAITARPVDFFTDLAPKGRVGSAALFLLFVLIPAGFVVNAVGYGTSILFPTDTSAFEEIFGDGPVTDLLVASATPSVFKSFLTACFYPVGQLLTASVLGLLAHLGLMVLGGAKHPLQATMKATYYAYGVMFWAVIPLLGAIVAGLWVYVLVAIAITHIHQARGWQGAIGVAWAPCLCCVLVVGGTIAFFAAIVSAMQGGGF